MPLGFSPLIPSKVTVSDAATPTHLELGDLRPNNPDVCYAVTHVPVFEVSLPRQVGKLVEE